MQQISQKACLADYSQNKEEYSVIKSFENKPTISKLGSSASDSIVDLMAKWRWMAGVSSNNQDELELAKELVLISSFVINNYESLTIDEINTAIDLSLTDKLAVDVRTFNVFSPMYVGKVLNAYIDFKRAVVNKVSDIKATKELKSELTKPVSDEYRMESMVELIRYMYWKYKSDGIINDVFNTVFSFLYRTKRLIVPKEMADAAVEYGSRMAIAEVDKTYGILIREADKPNRELIKSRYARNYCVQEYFSLLPDIDSLISGININDFYNGNGG